MAVSVAVRGDEPPQDIAAEQALLGLIMIAPDLYGEVGLKGEEFYRPAHETIWHAMGFLVGKGIRPDAVAVLGRLSDIGEAARVGGGVYLHSLIEWAGVPVMLATLVERIRDKFAKRRLIDDLRGSLQDATTSDDPVEDVVRRVESRISKTPVSVADLEDAMTLDEFLGQEIPPEDWVIPGLLDRGDRLMITGAEGLGKSVLMRQMGMAVAAGMDPFTGKTIPAMTVMIVDCENPLRIMMKVFANLKSSIMAHTGRGIKSTNLWIIRRPAGINLDSPGDRLWLKRQAQLINPDLLCIGPTYKLYEGEGTHEEKAARRVASAIDEVREAVGCAVVIEHHMPHAFGGLTRSVRPIGSSLWLRWPEFGIGIRLVETKDDDERRKIEEKRLVDVVHWRGGRDERSWPENLESGGATMPWVEAVIDSDT